MKKPLLVIVMLFAFSPFCTSQVDTTSGKTSFLPLVYANRDLTYFTLSDGVGNLPNMVTEARFSGSYFLKNNKPNWALEFNLNMTLRILDKESYPIPPPSYIPQLTYYRRINGNGQSALSKLLFEDAYWDISVGHHSNGRADDFFVKDSLGNKTDEIDLEDASFTLHYLEWGYSTFNHRKSKFDKDFYTNLRLALRVYPAPMGTPELEDNYGLYRAFATYNIFRLPGGGAGESDFLSQSRVRVHTGWIFGDVTRASADNIEKRLIAEVTWFYHPAWLAEMGFFVQYYHGQDYYNLQFERTVDALRFGISSNPLNFQGFKKYMKKN